MASYKLIIAHIRGCPLPKKLAELMEKYGLPDGDEYGVLDCSAGPEALAGTIVRRTQQTVQKLDQANKAITAQPVERITTYPFAVYPAKERLEIFAGSSASIDVMAAFFSSCLAQPTVIEPFELDIPAAVEKLSGSKRFQIRSVRVSDFAHNSYMIGPYSPKFTDNEHGKSFLYQYEAGLTAASVRFQGATGRVTLSLPKTACFSYSCKEEDQTAVKALLRSLVG
jgi:hypothetical protein